MPKGTYRGPSRSIVDGGASPEVPGHRSVPLNIHLAVHGAGGFRSTAGCAPNSISALHKWCHLPHPYRGPIVLKEIVLKRN
jgi:hypothetical protein